MVIQLPKDLMMLSKGDLVRLIAQQDEIIKELRDKNQELERRLLAYENAHTPPSKNKRRYPRRESTGNPVGAPEGHPGTTRPIPDPDEVVDLKQNTCTKCHTPLGKPTKIVKRIIEDIPIPQPVKVTQYNVHAYLCKHCAELNIAAHPDLPLQGRFGYNLQAQVALLKYEDRLPLEKIVNNLDRQHSLAITPATVLDILDRVAGSCEPAYEKIRKHVCLANNVCADETGQKVQGKQWWTWVFTTPLLVLFLIRKSRGQAPIKEVLGKQWNGILNCDGLKSYPRIVKLIQRCWAHLLREAKFLAQKHEGQARLTYNELGEIYKQVKQSQEDDLTLKERKLAKALLEARLQQVINRMHAYTALRKFATLIQNGLPFWFTCVLYPTVEPTNNHAERALREMVVQRKITGTLRNTRGTHIIEVLMSCIQTWKLQGLNTFSMLRQTLSS